MTPERRREIEEEEALRASIRGRATFIERWGCIYPLTVIGVLLLLMLGIGIYCWITGTTLRF